MGTGDWWPLHQSDEDAVPRRADFYLLVVGATVWHTQTDVVSCDNFTSIAVLHEYLACFFPHLSSLPIPSSIRPCYPSVFGLYMFGLGVFQSLTLIGTCR
jgi:hypothetical protein